MAEKNMTSSMTSVTEEDTSVDSESDTTESYTNITSSALSSSDYNTDDKLTPGLVNIQISRPSTYHQTEKDKSRKDQRDAIPHPPTWQSKTHIQPGKEINNHLMKLAMKQNRLRGQKRQFSSMEDNIGVNDMENKLSTDFSDTSSKPDEDVNNCNYSSEEESEDVEEASRTGTEGNRARPLLPDMTSDRWYEAKCFDAYWANYRYVMDWYQQHVKAVQTLSRSFSTASSASQQGRQRKRGKSKRSKGAERARKRRQAKEKRAAKLATSASQTEDSSSALTQEVEEDIEMEMPITDEMMEFFTKSLKHRLERDNEKTNMESETIATEMLTGEQVSTSQGPTTQAPKEQPGVRRTSEMKSLYGEGAAMIQGMETALQMTFDRITDRSQPKLWPNMPLRVLFH